MTGPCTLACECPPTLLKRSQRGTLPALATVGFMKIMQTAVGYVEISATSVDGRNRVLKSSPVYRHPPKMRHLAEAKSWLNTAWTKRVATLSPPEDDGSIGETAA